MKKFIVLSATLLCFQTAYADTVLTGGVNYNVNTARQELLSTSQSGIDQKFIRGHAYDFKNRSNLNLLLKGEVNQKDRTLAMFSDFTYAVMYLKDEYHVYYYKNNGSLLYVEEKKSLTYPYKAYKYDTAGNLVNMSLRVSKDETFIYTPQGKLIAHWIGANGYDDKGNVIMTRKYAE